MSISFKRCLMSTLYIISFFAFLSCFLFKQWAIFCLIAGQISLLVAHDLGWRQILPSERKAVAWLVIPPRFILLVVMGLYVLPNYLRR